MSNITKNLLLALTLVCVVMFFVFCIQLLVINRGVEPITPGQAVAGGPKQGEEDPDPGENGEEPSEGDEGENGNNDITQETPRPPPKGMRNEIPLSPDSTLIIYVDEELFDFEQGDVGWIFDFTGEGNAMLEVRFALITGGVGAYAETFLNSYSGGEGSEFNGKESIKGSPLEGYNVSLRYGGVTYEAWIHELADSDTALAFVITYQNDQQKDVLYEMLSTLDVETHRSSLDTEPNDESNGE